MTVGEALAHGTHVLSEAGIDSARLESELLLARACDDCARALLYMELRRDLSTREPRGRVMYHQSNDSSRFWKEKTADFAKAFEDATASGKPSIIHLKVETDAISPGTTLTAIRQKALEQG